MNDLAQIPGIGKTFVKDFARIGIVSQRQLMGAQAEELFDRLCAANARELHKTSRNYLYVIRMAIYAAGGGKNPELLRWNAWSDRSLAARNKTPAKQTRRNRLQAD